MFLFRLQIISILILSLILSIGRAAAKEGKNNIIKTISETLAKNEQSLIELRRDFHRFPELSGQEERTASILAKRLRSIGLEVQTGIGGHGVIAILVGGKPGPVVAYRADMDAIPTTGPDPVPFKSENEAVRHGCGHDIHMTVAVGIAEALASVREDLPGTVKFIFQPSEENAEGAAAVIADGALDNPSPEAIFAVHCAPLEVGTIGSRAGMLLGGIDVVQVDIAGDGDIETAVNGVGEVLASINTVNMSGGLELSGESGSFVMAGVFDRQPLEDGSGVTVTGMVRASSDKEHEQAKMAVEEGLDAITMDGVSLELTYTKYAVPPVMNDVALVERTNTVVTEVAGRDALLVIEGVTPFFSEDFSHFQNHIPGVMYYLGVSNSEKGTGGLPHSPMFVPDEGAIVFGANVMANVLLDYLVQH